MKNIYAVRDRIANDLAGHYPLVVFRTDAQAVRYFQDSMAIQNSALGAHPRDYELIKLGYVSDDGLITALPRPDIIITGEALVATQEKEPTTTQLQLHGQA